MKYLIGKKRGMTQRFLDTGEAVAVTVIEAPDCQVTAVKSKDRDGYDAVQIGSDIRKKLSKSEKGHLQKLPTYGTLKEFPQQSEKPLAVGDKLTVKQFVAGDLVDIIGTSKGSGFQGVVKRHKFKGSLATHGHKDQLRMPGSIGATEPARVFRGTRMAGQMGAQKATAKNLEIIEVIPEENLLLVKGAIAGPASGLITVFSTSTTVPPEEPNEKNDEAPNKQDEKPIDAAPEEKKEAPQGESKDKS